jgi:UDP-N-acetylglucosamine:LPS N-acetylglucosamine transferase
MEWFKTLHGKKIAIITGGTAGHVIPANELAAYCDADLFVNDDGVKFCFYEKKQVFSFQEKDLIDSIFFIFYFLYKLRKYDVIIGFGGFFCLPAILAGRMLLKEVYVHEQNMILGQANKLAYFLGAKVLKSFENTLWSLNNPLKNGITTGFPISKNTQENNYKFLHQESFIFITAGSLGSAFFDETLLNIITKFAEERKILCYFQSKKPSSSSYVITSVYFDNFQELILKAKVVISRAGANTIGNLTLLNKDQRVILIPLPNARQNHQLLNAKNSGFIFMEQHEIISNSQKIIEMINIILKEEKNLKIQPSTLKLFITNKESKENLNEESKESTENLEED